MKRSSQNCQQVQGILTTLRNGRILFSCILALAVSMALVASTPPRSPARSGIVVTYHPEATQAGYEILQAGGNAFDAFVGTTMADFVVAEGGTSLAGPLGALVYDKKSGARLYLDGEFNDVKHPRGRWTAEDPKPGKAVLVPGAVASLEALSSRYGRLPFAQVLQPAIKLARDGFKINQFYAAMIAWRTDVLRHSDYGRRTFFPQGKALQAGDLLKQPDLTNFLTRLSQQGSSYMYQGEWAARCVEAVRAQGGLLSREDLASYRPAWVEPLKISYREHEICSTGGRTFGGLWTLLALKTLEQTKTPSPQHFSASADALELLVQIARAVWAESWIFDFQKLDDRTLVELRLTRQYAEKIYSRVKGQILFSRRSASPDRRILVPHRLRPVGSHSYHVVVGDADGNLVTGTNTSQSLPWGDGIFVEGIPLTTGGMVPWGTRPGERRLSPFVMHLVFKNGSARFASGTISGSLIEASLQFLVNFIDYNLPASQLVSLPRFGTFPHDITSGDVTATLDWKANWLDPRVDRQIVDTLKARGLSFEQEGFLVDTGYGAAVVVLDDGSLEGDTAPWTGLTTPFPQAARNGLSSFGNYQPNKRYRFGFSEATPRDAPGVNK